MIWWILGLFAGLVILGFVPLFLVCEVHEHGIRIRVRWLGLSFAMKQPRAPKPEAEKPTPEDERSFDPAVLWHHRQSLLQALKVALDLARRLVRSWTLVNGHLSLTFGTGNPATTGMLYGGLAAVAGVFARIWPQVRVDCQAQFEERIMQLQGQLVFRTRPWTLIGHITVAAFRLPWRGLWHMRREFASS